MKSTHLENEHEDWLSQLRWDPQGLLPVIAQDWETGQILMQAFTNEEALRLSVKENRAIYWSRSRQRLWRKGESSGHIQVLQEVLVDCDNDSLIFVVEQIGGIACHTGHASCYYRRLDVQLNHVNWQETSEVLKSPMNICGENK
jgi:phosphoribosyl-AMP cyclohydrolase